MDSNNEYKYQLLNQLIFIFPNIININALAYIYLIYCLSYNHLYSIEIKRIENLILKIREKRLLEKR